MELLEAGRASLFSHSLRVSPCDFMHGIVKASSQPGRKSLTW